MNWTQAANADGYELRWRATGSTSWLPSSPQVVSGASTETYLIENLANGTGCEVQVKATTTDAAYKNSDWSDSETATPAAPLSAPANLALTAGDTKIDVAWDMVANATGCQLRWSRDSGATWLPASPQVVSGGGPTTAVISGLANGDAYEVQVKATTTDAAFENSGWSGSHTATPATPLPTPDNLMLAPADGKLTVSWDAPGDAPSGTTYMAWTQTRAVATGAWGGEVRQSCTDTATSCEVTGLSNRNECRFRVRAISPDASQHLDSDESAWSEAVEVGIPLSLVPTFEVESGDAAFTVRWSGVSDSSVGGREIEICRAQAADPKLCAPEAVDVISDETGSGAGVSVRQNVGGVNVVHGANYRVRMRLTAPGTGDCVDGEWSPYKNVVPTAMLATPEVDSRFTTYVPSLGIQARVKSHALANCLLVELYRDILAMPITSAHFTLPADTDRIVFWQPSATATPGGYTVRVVAKRFAANMDTTFGDNCGNGALDPDPACLDSDPLDHIVTVPSGAAPLPPPDHDAQINAAMQSALSSRARGLLEDASEAIGQRMASAEDDSGMAVALADLLAGTDRTGCAPGGRPSSCGTPGWQGSSGIVSGHGTDRFGRPVAGERGGVDTLPGLRDLVRQRGFAVSLSGMQEGAPGSVGRTQFAFWGDGGADDALWWGMDARRGDRWLAGVSWADSADVVNRQELAFRTGSVSGSAESDVSAVYP